MPRIFLIGKNLGTYGKALSSSGNEVVKFTSPKAALKRINEADIVLLDGGQKESFKEIMDTTMWTPKLILSTEGAPKASQKWLREPSIHYLHKPSEKDVLTSIERLKKQKKLMNETKNLQFQLHIAEKQISFFEEINRLLTSSSDLNAILVVIMKKIKEMTGAVAWSILLVDEESGELVFERAEGSAKKRIRKFRLKPGEGVAGWVAKEGKPVVVKDVDKDRRFMSRVDSFTNFRTKSLMSVPIMGKGKVLGVLEVVNKKSGESFTEDDLDLLLRLVDQAALAIERTSLYQKMEELVITDDLTKLFNTRYLNRTIETEVMRSNRYNTSVGLIFMDIDFFKAINDNYGHLVGSKMLVEMGQILLNQLRAIDIVARYGGDEFVIVLPQTSPKDTVMIAERIRRTVERHVFLKSEGYNLKVTSSFGVASYPESAKTKEDLMRLADEAMYKVKHRTRNGVYAII